MESALWRAACLDAWKAESQSRQLDGHRMRRAYAYNLVRLLVHAAIRAKPGFSMRQMQLLGVFGVATLRNGVKPRDLAVFYYSIVFETASPSIPPPPTMLNPLRPLSRSVRHFSSPAPASCKSPLMQAPPRSLPQPTHTTRPRSPAPPRPPSPPRLRSYIRGTDGRSSPTLTTPPPAPPGRTSSPGAAETVSPLAPC